MTTSPTILVADADEESRLSLVEALQEADPGATIIEAANGLELGRSLREAPIDVLFVDVTLPQTEGADILNWRSAIRPGGIIVIVTDQLAPRWPSLATRIGAYEVILKPIGTKQVRRLLEARQLVRRTLNLLVVDPGQETRSLIRRLLQRSNFSFEVIEAENGHAALGLAKRTPLDIAIIEMGLPDVPGLEVACQIHERQRDARLVMMGVKIDASVQRHFGTFGVSAFLRKPFQFAGIDKAVHEVFGLWYPYLITALQTDAARTAAPKAMGQSAFTARNTG